jgi:hypothetical protein
MVSEEPYDSSFTGGPWQCPALAAHRGGETLAVLVLALVRHRVAPLNQPRARSPGVPPPHVEPPQAQALAGARAPESPVAPPSSSPS